GNSFHVVAILAAPAIRYERAKTRARFGALSKLEFRIRDREEPRVGVGDLIASSNHYVVANGSEKEVQRQIDALLKQLI
ncbi:MAG: hypothetical protein QXQ79_00005, partial [Candidatus Nanoarchaeia archaeon]